MTTERFKDIIPGDKIRTLDGFIWRVDKVDSKFVHTTSLLHGGPYRFHYLEADELEVIEPLKVVDR